MHAVSLQYVSGVFICVSSSIGTRYLSYAYIKYQNHIVTGHSMWVTRDCIKIKSDIDMWISSVSKNTDYDAINYYDNMVHNSW